MASSQMEQFTEINLKSAKRMADIVNEMLTPETLAPDYPLSKTDVDPVTWEQIPEEAKTNGVSYHHIDYGYISQAETARAKAFAQKYSGLLGQISASYRTQYGLEGNANPAELRIRYWDLDDLCSNLKLYYPAKEPIPPIDMRC